MALADGVPVAATLADDADVARGVNDRAQLAAAERIVQRRRAEALMRAGTTIADPSRIDIRGTLDAANDTFIDVGCVFEGKVTLGAGATIGPYCVLRDTSVGANTEIQAYSHLDGATIGAGARIGPFARLRPGAALADDVHIGNFVEVKAASLGPRSKANHLAYIGDASLGADVNFGAGSITANYDGANKHRTTIGDDVHVGSNCVLVAPIEVGAGATIGGGSTITGGAPAGELTLTRAKQVTVAGWKRPRKKKPA
jgi:bifunctional UDP-N-acetylglucosamine pyrophosphorylase/glucosamine-1-phosphate N-acetyltransferase